MQGTLHRKHTKRQTPNSHPKCLRDTLGLWPCLASRWHISDSRDTIELSHKELAPACFPSSAGGWSHRLAVKNVICSPTGSKGELSCALSSLMNNIPLLARCDASTSSLCLPICQHLVSGGAGGAGGILHQPNGVHPRTSHLAMWHLGQCCFSRNQLRIGTPEVFHAKLCPNTFLWCNIASG